MDEQAVPRPLAHVTHTLHCDDMGEGPLDRLLVPCACGQQGTRAGHVGGPAWPGLCHGWANPADWLGHAELPAPGTWKRSEAFGGVGGWQREDSGQDGSGRRQEVSRLAGVQEVSRMAADRMAAVAGDRGCPGGLRLR